MSDSGLVVARRKPLARWGQPPAHLAERFYPWQAEGWMMLARMLYLSFFASQRKPIRIMFEWCRQSGKNELSAAWDTFCLMMIPRWIAQGKLCLPAPPSGGAPKWEAIHSAPTFNPGIMVAKRRLEAYLQTVAPGVFHKEDGRSYRICAGSPAVLNLVSAGPQANRRSLSANGYLRVDEVQHTSHQVYSGELSPMCASTGAPEILQGTRWTRTSLGTVTAHQLQELEREDGIPRYLRIPASLVAEHNPAYAAHYAQQVKLLGPKHPAIQGEYDIVDPEQARAFLRPEEYERLFGGSHGPLERPEQGKVYVAGIDFCGAGENPDEAALDPSYTGKRDCTCLRIGELDWRETRELVEVAPGKFEPGEANYTPVVRIRFTKLWPGKHPEDIVPDLVALVRLFRCARVRGDAGGAGDGPCAMLERRLGKSVFEGLKSNGSSAKRMGLRLLGAIGSGRFEDFTEEVAGPWLAESRKQYAHLEKEASEGGSFKWGHPTHAVPGEGNVHDDIPKADGLLVEAAYDHLARVKPAQRQAIPNWDEAAGYET